MREFKAPDLIEVSSSRSIFLAGTIEMGTAEDWQAKILNMLPTNLPLDVYNPRRTHWNNSLKQDFSDPTFHQQVTWELDALERADLIIMNLLGDSKSPISLLELGLYANSGKLVVCCSEDFWRYGNVQIICNRYRIPLFKTLEELIEKTSFYK